MKQRVEQMMVSPSGWDYIGIVVLSPLAFVYGLYMLGRRLLASRKDFGLPIVSIGNLVVGGSGKTPFVIQLASQYDKVAVISRGYGRKSKGLIEVSQEGKLLATVEQSGDEAILMAKLLPQASVIVSEDRQKAIALAKRQGAELIVLDDGFNRVDIEKFEVLLEPQEIKNYLPFPAGAFREFWFSKRYADIVAKEGSDFKRVVHFEALSQRMLLVTAIANPERLNAYLPEGVVQKIYLEDHAYFSEKSLKEMMEKCDAETLLVTEKDAVKMQDFKLPLSKMKLKLEIEDEIFIKIDHYIKGYQREK